MKAISDTLLDTQVSLGAPPVVSAQIQAYGYPAESTNIAFKEYDWTSVLETSKGAAAACCASDGSFVITSGTSATTVRIANSPAIDLDTVFTAWGAAGTKGTFAPGNTFCIGANPTSNEVIIAYLSGGHLYRQTSTDYGASFGAATDMGASSGTVVRLAYNSLGDLAIIVGYTSTNQAAYSINIRYSLELKAYIRTSSSWTTTTLTSEFDYYKFTLGYYTSWLDYNFQHPQGEYINGYVYYPIILESIDIEYDIVYDPAWLITYTASQTSPGSAGGDGKPITKGSIIYGLYYQVLTTTFLMSGEISLTDISTKINSLSQLSHFSPSPLTGEGLSYEQTTMPIFFSQPELLRTATVHPAAYLHKISGYPLILSLYSDGRVYLCELKRGKTLFSLAFDKAYTFNNDRPVKLCSNDTWLFAYNGDQIFMCPLPSDWVAPTAGSGAGTTVTPPNAILKVEESVGINQPSRLSISYNNSDGYFDSPGSGALAPLKRGSRVNLSLGYTVGGTDYTAVYARYFVDSWNYTRGPNRSIFELNCIDAWGLLEKYRFNRRVNFNYYGATTTYSIYQLIEMLCKSIGGSLTYTNRSAFISSFRPVLEVNTGETAASVLRRLMLLIPDQIKFFGNEAVIYYPQETDGPIYYYSGPT